MKVLLQRFVDDSDTTGGALFINGKFECFIVEDEEREIKKWGEMRIPNGTYDISFRKVGGFHNRYKKKFASIHKGMLQVTNTSNKADSKIVVGDIKFQYVLIHVGNSDNDTAGCLLPNETFNSSTMRGSGSVNAYKRMYPKIATALSNNERVTLDIIDIEPS
jgi:hypothetical protein